MGMSKSYLGYNDCREALERALNSRKGIRLTYPNKGQAFRFVGRCNAFRVKDREESLKLYDENNVMWGRSPYDVLVICRAANIVEIRPAHLDLDIVEDIE
jgi:hypothetical protein